MEIAGSLDESLKQRRKTPDPTQEELAECAGCSVFALRKIETGEQRPSKQRAGLLADALEISEDDRPTFIRVARGNLRVERVRASSPGSKPASLAPQPATYYLPLPPTPLSGRDPDLAAMQRIYLLGLELSLRNPDQSRSTCRSSGCDACKHPIV